MRAIGPAFAALVAILSVTAPALAGAPTDQVRRYTDEVQTILADTTVAEVDKRAAVRRVATQVFDVTETAKRALGRHWA
ncbi:MAG: hypothetical protein ACREJG_00400, partial [Candidatus Rokuibacteriota bacterium]